MRGFPLSDGSIIELVVGHLRTPCGRVVQRQYRSIATREYYRLARADRDTAGRPSCRTDAGRVVYGGGGIYPDLVLNDQDLPPWQSRLGEENLILKWVGGYVTANAAVFSSLDAFTNAGGLSRSAVDNFRSFAASQGVTIPAIPEADAILQHMLSAASARAKFGDGGFYRVAAHQDPEVEVARKAFDDVRFAFPGRQP